MRVLLDRHHAGLYHSMQLLGDRLGWDIYTPIGHEWWDEGYWSFGRWTWPDDRLAQQYLTINDSWIRASENLHWTKDSEFPDRWIYGITLDDAKRINEWNRWDLVIATLQDNQEGFARFAREVGARYVYQVGNTGQQVNWGLDPVVLMASEMPMLGRGVYYHQPMDPIAFAEHTEIRSAASFVNCMPDIACWPLLRTAQERMPIAVHGIDGPDGVIKPLSRSIEIMGNVGWGWHDKIHGDGFGHVIHGWAAVGRPLIGHASHYRGKMAEGLWVDGETCIDLDRHPVGEAVDIVLSMTPERHREMCRAIRAEFDRIDWEGEAEQIRELLMPQAVAA